MAKVDTNTVSLLYREASTGDLEGVTTANQYGTANNAYTASEPNDISTFAADVTTTAREPISNRLQRQKGAITDVTASAEFTADTTMSAMLNWIPAAAFAEWQNKAHRDLIIDSDSGKGISGSNGSRVINFKVSEQVIPLAYAVNTLLWTEGFGNSGNNGLQEVKTVPTAQTGTTIAIEDGDTVAEASSGATVSVTGYRLAVAATTAWAWDSDTGQATLTSSAAHITAMLQVLKKGQVVHFGSVAKVGGAVQNAMQRGGTVMDSAAGNRFDSDGNPAADNKSVWGLARYTGTTTSTTLVFDNVDPILQLSGSQASGDVLKQSTNMDIIYGDFLKNVATTDALYLDRTFSLALVSQNLLDTGDGVEYAAGSKIGPLAIEFALNDKSTFTASFVSRDVEAPQAPAGSNVTTKKETKNSAYSTVADFARLRLSVDTDSIYTDFKSLTVTLDPQISPENVLGKLGAQYVNRGNLNVTAEAEVIFASDVVPKAIRNNSTASFDCAIINDNGALIFDVPAMTIGGGGRSYPTNAAVTITATGDSFEDTDHGASIMVSQFYVPVPKD